MRVILHWRIVKSSVLSAALISSLIMSRNASAEIGPTLPTDSKTTALPNHKKLPTRNGEANPGEADPAAAPPKPHIVKEFTNPDCQKTQSCDLKSFKIEVTKTYAGNDQRDTSYDDLYQGDLMVASYETRDLASLEKYGIVQFIKGCNLGVTMQETMQNGQPLPYIYSQRSFFDFTQPFLHPDWVVDSIDTDPMYASVPYDPSRYGSVPESQWKRHAGHRIYKPNPFADETPEQQTAYQFKNPPTSKLYIFDYPSGSYGSSDRRKGEYSYASMIFRTCVFKAQDIPKEATPNWNGNGKALACFGWSNNHRYDSVRDLFVDATTVDPRCEDKAWADQVYRDFNTPIGERPLDWSKRSSDLGIPSRSCDALYGAELSNGTYFAGDLCVDHFHKGKDSSKFLTPVNKDGRFAPNPFLTYKLVAGGGTSVRLSTARQDGFADLATLFQVLKTRAKDVMSRVAAPSAPDQAMLARLDQLDLVLLEQGPGCDGGAELTAQYDAVIDSILVCPAWTNLPKEAMLEMLAVQMARVFDACSIKPIYKMKSNLITDLKSSNPKLVQTCFSKDPELNSPQTIASVTAQLQDVVYAGREEFETIQTKIDAGLIKCSLTQLSNRALPKEYDQFAAKDVWSCARKASGDSSPDAPITSPWLNKTVCSDRVREITQNTFAADLMSYYLSQNPGVVAPETKTLLLYGRVGRACVAQGMTGTGSLSSLERLGLYLNRTELRSAIGCTETTAPALCDSRLFSSP